MSLILSLGGIYFFIFLGYISKRIFQDKIDEKGFVLFSIYFLQPILIFWGLTTKKIDSSVIDASFIFTIVILLALVVSFFLVNILFKDQKDRSIATVSSIIGNTGNLGIPLGIALFGTESIIYTSIINLVNVFLVYVIGVYFYARGNFSVLESVKSIFKLPTIWFGIFAIIFNYLDLTIWHELLKPMEMGAYATMVIQLSIFGMYLYSVKYKEIDWKLFNFIAFMKFLLIPIISVVVLGFFKLEPLVYNVILLELLVPLAVMNLNLASLYDCKPTQVAFLVFATSVIFMFYLFAVVEFLFR